jgi:hypothetical protein
MGMKRSEIKAARKKYGQIHPSPATTSFRYNYKHKYYGSKYICDLPLLYGNQRNEDWARLIKETITIPNNW